MAVIQDMAALAVRASGPEPVGLDACQTWALLAQRRAAWSAVMGGPGDVVGLRLGDGFEFAAALLGAWNAGVTVVLPGDATPLTLAALRSRTQRIFIGDEAVPSTPSAPAPVRPRSTMPDVPVVVFTSGSTGDPVAIPKTLRCIQNELHALE
ncbi:MAG: AMP-binding protein, partial [bacterium]